ncbi:hypothetical protein [Streptomyces sp. Je 1-369]|uniref:hypothetical protein n=1 Tax=Streptomyces sp. Je 1-369 TaxID=2966192 RepID=UPI0022860C40|nr:hypothetical protein [Streptomyces sp. Je 1-369]WAL93973.1 hypothetical protein NOO62_05340 [Streptomyces sp. Je 1-369]
MIAVGGLVLALICLATVGLAAAIAAVTWGNRSTHWLADVASVFAMALAGFCLVLATIAQVAEGLRP